MTVYSQVLAIANCNIDVYLLVGGRFSLEDVRLNLSLFGTQFKGLKMTEQV